MPQNTNYFVLTGRLVAEPKDKFVQKEDNSKLNITIAVNRKVKKDAPENTQKADFIPLIAFGHNAENIVKVCKKGDLCTFEGNIRSYKATNKETGEIIYGISHVVKSFNLQNPAKNKAVTEHNANQPMEVSAPQNEGEKAFEACGTPVTPKENIY